MGRPHGSWRRRWLNGVKVRFYGSTGHLRYAYTSNSSPLSRLNRWIELTQLSASIIRREAPIDARTKPVSLPAPSLSFTAQLFDAAKAPSPETLFDQHRDLDLHHVQP